MRTDSQRVEDGSWIREFEKLLEPKAVEKIVVHRSCLLILFATHKTSREEIRIKQNLSDQEKGQERERETIWRVATMSEMVDLNWM